MRPRLRIDPPRPGHLIAPVYHDYSEFMGLIHQVVPPEAVILVIPAPTSLVQLLDGIERDLNELVGVDWAMGLDQTAWFLPPDVPTRWSNRPGIASALSFSSLQAAFERLSREAQYLSPQLVDLYNQLIGVDEETVRIEEAMQHMAEHNIHPDQVGGLLDVAREGNEQLFKDIALCLGALPDTLDELWTGTLARVNRKKEEAPDVEQDA